ncbi:MAG: RIP metalloprotease RseP [Pseudomonadota bacterium]
MVLDFLYNSNLLSLWFYLGSFILIISFIVFIHEFGHYYVAKLCKVKIECFSIGFGKELFGFNDKSGTRWKFCLIPMGGYVKMLGDADPASSPDVKKINSLTEEQKQYAFYAKKLWQKTAIVFAGPLANYILAIVILASFYVVYGKSVYQPVISNIVADMPAANSGMQIGDKITKIDNKDINEFNDIVEIISLNTGDPVNVTFTRDNKNMDLTLTPKIIERKSIFGTKERVALIGIYPPQQPSDMVELNIFHSTWLATQDSVRYSAQILRAISQIILGKRTIEDLGGPVKIAKYSGEAAKFGLKMVFWFIAMISISLGLFNLLPIPALDGGHLFFYLIEALKGSPVTEKIQQICVKTSIIFILILAVFITYNDITMLLE